mgnify:CR=1 FL=1
MDDLTTTRRRVLALAQSKFPDANEVRPVARSAGNGALILGAEVWIDGRARSYWPEGAVVA